MSIIYAVIITCDRCGMDVMQSAPIPVGGDEEEYRRRLAENGWHQVHYPVVNGEIVGDYCPKCKPIPPVKYG